MIGLVVFGFALGGCGSDDDSDSADSETTTNGGDSSDCGQTGDPDAVAVSLSEWDIEVPGEFTGGSVTIAATNDGGETHELVIVRADSVDGWEKEDGKVLEDQFAEGGLHRRDRGVRRGNDRDRNLRTGCQHLCLLLQHRRGGRVRRRRAADTLVVWEHLSTP